MMQKLTPPWTRKSFQVPMTSSAAAIFSLTNLAASVGLMPLISSLLR
jgi:hypothetical protein